MTEIFEILMVVSFGISWPVSIYKSIKSKTTKGKSLTFTLLIWIGYIFGIISKLLNHHINYVLIFYIINLLTVTADILLYFHNLKYDKGNLTKYKNADA